MRARRMLFVVLVGLVAAVPLGAQGRHTIGGRAMGPIGTHRGPSAPRTPVRTPFRTTGIVPPLAGSRGHHPIAFRSTTFGLVLIDPYWWWTPPEAGENVGAAAALTAPMTPVPLPTGGVQLDVEPRSALVYVDGTFAGHVDRFSGYYQHLEAPAGLHIIDLVAPDYEPLTISITVVPGQTSTYRTSLNHANRH